MNNGGKLSSLFRKKKAEPVESQYFSEPISKDQLPAMAMISQDGYGDWVAAMEVSHSKDRRYSTTYFIYSAGGAKGYLYSMGDLGYRFKSEDQAKAAAKQIADDYNTKWTDDKKRQSKSAWTVLDADL